jgi:tRNA A-37 threonylcarbamoyl transferase component Bud32
MKSKLVYSDDGKSLIKYCRSQEDCANELRVYRLKLAYTPELIRIIDDRTIEIARIRGKTLSAELNFDPFRIGRMLSALHEAKSKDDLVLSHIDTNPRNYLIEDRSGDYYYIDFSESRYSYPEHDLINFLLFWAAILPNNKFINVMHDLLNGYNTTILFDRDREKSLFPEWIEIFDNRRKQYGKTPCLNEEWQKRNRQYLRKNFYPFLHI